MSIVDCGTPTEQSWSYLQYSRRIHEVNCTYHRLYTSVHGAQNTRSKQDEERSEISSKTRARGIYWSIIVLGHLNTLSPKSNGNSSKLK